MLGMRILLGVCGGIAAVESVKLCRELRRHGAEVTVILTHSAQKIITPLALRWGSASQVVTDWTGSMESLENFDAILVAPATRNLLAGISMGMMDSPLLMAISSAISFAIFVLVTQIIKQSILLINSS